MSLPLRRRVLSNPETLQDLALACIEKYWEGLGLLVSGQRGAGIYLLGYSAEMALKIACFLFDGARPHDLVGPRLGPIRSWARSELPDVSPESYHSLLFWMLVLRRKRDLRGRRLPLELDQGVLQRVRRLHSLWIVCMRYKPDDALDREAESVLADVTWIRDRLARLGA